MKERGRSNYQDKSGYGLYFLVFLWHKPGLTKFSRSPASPLRSLQDSVMDPRFIPAALGPPRPILPALSSAASVAPSVPSAPHHSEDGTGHCTGTLYLLHARGRSNHPSPWNCQMYSYASQQWKCLSMNTHKVVRFHYIQEVGSVFEQETCPRHFPDSSPTPLLAVSL